MPSYPEILIIRHGQTVWNAEGRMQGAQDSPLTALGRAQAAQLRGLLGQAGLSPAHKAWCSPRGRAQETAQIALQGHFDSYETDARLAEISVGRIEGLTLEEAQAAYPREMAPPLAPDWHFHAPGGESYAVFSARIADWLDALDAPAVVVAHGIVSRVMRGLLLGLAPTDMPCLPGGQGLIYRIRDGAHHVLDAPGPWRQVSAIPGLNLPPAKGI